jgi:hypothetical protein
MKGQRYLPVFLLCLLGPGCSMFEAVAVNVVTAPVDALDDVTFHLRNRKLAQVAWDDLRRSDPAAAYSADYGRGFIAGYADFLNSGGRPVPPAVPPWRYRRPKYETPEGYRAIEDWYAGFAHGNAAACAWGAGQLLRLPSSGVTLDPLATPPLPAGSGPPLPPGPPGDGPALPPGPVGAGHVPPPEAVEELPPPKPVMPEADMERAGPRLDPADADKDP